MKKKGSNLYLKAVATMIGKFKTILHASAMLLLASCSKHTVEPSAETATRIYSFNHIERITVSSPAVIVYYSQGNETSVKAKGPSNMVEDLRIKTNASNILMIELENTDAFNITSESQSIKVWVSSPTINSFEAMNGASIIAPESICSPTRITIDTYTGSKANFSDIKCEYVKAEAFQGSEIIIDRVQASYIDATPYTGASIIIADNTIK